MAPSGPPKPGSNVPSSRKLSLTPMGSSIGPRAVMRDRDRVGKPDSGQMTLPSIATDLLSDLGWVTQSLTLDGPPLKWGDNILPSTGLPTTSFSCFQFLLFSHKRYVSTTDPSKIPLGRCSIKVALSWKLSLPITRATCWTDQHPALYSLTALAEPPLG